MTLARGIPCAVALGVAAGSWSAGCGDGGSGPDAGGEADVVETDDGTPPSGPCADRPLRQEAAALLASATTEAMEAAGESLVVPSSAYDASTLYALNFFDYEFVRDRQETAAVYHDAAALAAAPGMSSYDGLIDDMEVDWADEAVVIQLAWPRQFAYTYGLSGSHLTIHAGHLLPCDEFPEDEWRLYFREEPLFLRVPRAVDAVNVQIATETYRFVDVEASGACARSPGTPVIGGSGGDATVLLDGGRYHMWYGGFSAATGCFFDTWSDDGVAWDPAGWDDAHLSRFESHSSYSDHYSPSILPRPGGGYWAYFKDLTSSGLTYLEAISRSESDDGIRWTAGSEVLPLGEPGSWDEAGVGSPTVLEHEGRFWMWYGGWDARGATISIGLATSDDGTVFERRAGNPVFTAGAAGTYDDLGVASPEVRHDGTRFVMLYSAITGGGDWRQAQTTSIGLATSDDGVSWTRLDAPVLAPEEDWEWNGAAMPSFLFEDGGATLWYTGVNDRAEPSIARALCDLP